MDSRKKFKGISAAAIVFVVVATVYVTKAFITTILWSLLVAYLLYPFYSYLFHITRNKQVSALLSISMVFAVFIISSLIVVGALVTEVSNLSLSQYALDEEVDNLSIFVSGFAEEHAPWAAQYTEEISHEFGDFVRQVVPKILSIAGGVATGLASGTPRYLAQFTVAILLVYYLLIDGENAVTKAIDLLPERELVSQFLDELKPIYHSLWGVYFITCILTGAIAAVGFLLLGVSYPILWGIVIAVFALLPLVGADVVYIPVALYYLVIQDYTRGASILIFGFVFLNLIPGYLIRPRLAMSGASIHPAITLLSFVAPLFVIGSVGIVVGPALYGFLLAAYRMKVRLAEAAAASDEGGGTENELPAE